MKLVEVLQRVLMDYDAFSFNGTNTDNTVEDGESEVEAELETKSENTTIVKDKSDRKQIG